MISRKELHKKTLPEHKKIFVKTDVVSYYLWRPICDYLTILLLDSSVSPTGITILSFYSCILAMIMFVGVPGVKGALLGYFFYWVWNIADGVDGNLARYRDQCTKSGDLWDAVAGYMAMVVFYLGAGVVAAKEASRIPIVAISPDIYVLMGAIASICTIFPRLATQKKESVYGKDVVKGLKDRSYFDWKKKIAVNLISINGFAGMMFLISIITRTVNYFITVYFFIMLLFGAFSLYSVMRKLKE